MFILVIISMLLFLLYLSVSFVDPGSNLVYNMQWSTTCNGQTDPSHPNNRTEHNITEQYKTGQNRTGEERRGREARRGEAKRGEATQYNSIL